MTLDQEDIEAIADAVVRKQANSDLRYPVTMTTDAVAEKLGCHKNTVLINGTDWGLRKIGRGKAIRWCGLSVKRYVEGGAL